MIKAFIYGLTLAIGLIIPLGAQNIFIFNQGATQAHFVRAFPSVLTAFICDLILILCAIFGISLIVLNQPWLKNAIFIFGIIFLCYISYSTWKNKVVHSKETKPFSTTKQISFAASVSLLNPHAIVDTIGVIGTNSLHFSGYDKLAFTLACVSVSFIWFLGLSISGHYFNKFDKTGYGVLLINKISAIIILCVAIFLAWQLFLN